MKNDVIEVVHFEDKVFYQEKVAEFLSNLLSNNRIIYTLVQEDIAEYINKLIVVPKKRILIFDLRIESGNFQSEFMTAIDIGHIKEISKLSEIIILSAFIDERIGTLFKELGIHSSQIIRKRDLNRSNFIERIEKAICNLNKDENVTNFLDEKRNKNLSWLHLSDLHFNNDSYQLYDENRLLNKMIVDISSQLEFHSINLDFVFITGDLSYRGLRGGYKLSTAFINKMQNELKIDDEDIYIIPGNHDVNHRWNKSSSYNLRDFRKRILASKSYSEYDRLIHKIQIEKKDKKAIFLQEGIRKRFNYYQSELIEKRFPKCELTSYTDIVRKNGIKIGIIGLNSAVLSFGGSRDLGKIILGVPQVEMGLKEANESELKIALIHHPTKWLHAYEGIESIKLLFSEFDFILAGHDHDNDFKALTVPDGSPILVSSGAAYEKRNGEHSYNIVSIEENKINGSKAIFRKITRRKSWGIDQDKYPKIPDGIHYFTWKKSATAE